MIKEIEPITVISSKKQVVKSNKTFAEVLKKELNKNGKEKNKMAKLLKDIKGFDDVGIGVVWCNARGGTYIRVADLEGYDLSNVQIYRYHTFCRTMRKVDKLEKDNSNEVFCVKREDLT